STTPKPTATPKPATTPEPVVTSGATPSRPQSTSLTQSSTVMSTSTSKTSSTNTHLTTSSSLPSSTTNNVTNEPPGPTSDNATGDFSWEKYGVFVIIPIIILIVLVVVIAVVVVYKRRSQKYVLSGPKTPPLDDATVVKFDNPEYLSIEEDISDKIDIHQNGTKPRLNGSLDV
ncbi:unnamed protein product, partial [Owenia fusiformis]